MEAVSVNKWSGCSKALNGLGASPAFATTGVATLKARVRTGSAQSLLERAAPHDITLRGPSLWSLLTH